MSGRHRRQLPQGTWDDESRAPVMPSVTRAVMKAVNPLPDGAPEQWLDGLRAGQWPPDSLEIARRYRSFGWVTPLSIAETKAKARTLPPDEPSRLATLWRRTAAIVRRSQ